MKHIDELFAPGEILSGQLDGKQLTEEEVRGLPDFQISAELPTIPVRQDRDLFCAIRGYEKRTDTALSPRLSEAA